MHQRALWIAILAWASLIGPPLSAYSLIGTKWTAPTITLHLQLGASSTPLSDGFTSWGASAADALATWNSHISSSKFVVVHDSNVSRASRNGLNNVYFSNTVNGQAWGANVLAVTLTYSSGNTQT